MLIPEAMRRGDFSFYYKLEAICLRNVCTVSISFVKTPFLSVVSTGQTSSTQTFFTVEGVQGSASTPNCFHVSGFSSVSLSLIALCSPLDQDAKG